jgi:TPR repeat protein
MSPEVELAAFEAFRRRDYRASARLLDARGGDLSVPGMVCLGWLWKRGLASEIVDVDRAVALWRSAAALGSQDAMYYLARTHLESANATDARQLFAEAASAGHSPSMYWLGSMMMAGEGGERDLSGARHWLEQAEATGHAFAKRDLLRLDILQSTSFAKRLYLRARLVCHSLRTLPRLFRSPDSDDFR